VSGRRAIFLDRDGTLNESVGYVNHESRFHLYPWSVEAIRVIGEEGWLAVLVTNQSGIGRGFFPEKLVEKLHGELQVLLGEAGAGLDGVYHCPHLPDAGCECRKPRPGMLLRAAEELGIDLAESWMIGDRICDWRAWWSARTRASLVQTGFGRGSFEFERDGWGRQPDLVGVDVYRVICDIFWGRVA